MSRVTGHAVPVWEKRRESEKRSAASPSKLPPCYYLSAWASTFHRDGGWSSASAIHFVDWHSIAFTLSIRLAPLSTAVDSNGTMVSL